MFKWESNEASQDFSESQIWKKIQSEKKDPKLNIEIEIDAPIQTNDELLKKYNGSFVYQCGDKGVALDSMLEILLEMDDKLTE